MKARHWKLIGIMLVIGVTACLVTYADRDREEKTSLPATVKAAIATLYPQAVIEEAEAEEEGLKVYEIKLKQNGEEFEITVAPDGAMVEFESKLAIDNLPPAVAQALAKAAEGAVINEISEEIIYAKVVLVKLDKPATTYEAELTKDGVEIELKLAADGTILEQKVKNDDDEDDEDDDEDEDDEDEDDDDEDEQQISIDQAPAAVRATILKEAEGGTIEEIDLEDEDGQAVYEADVIINGQEVEIRVAEDGTLLSKQVEDEDDEDADDEDDDDEDDDDEDEEDD